MTNGGASIWLVLSARIEDADHAWSALRGASTSFGLWLYGGTDRQAYYTARNRAYFEKHCCKPTGIRAINRWLFLLLLCVLAMFAGKMDRYRIILQAIKEGEAGLLGISQRFPLDE
jgi:hypothetical protein